MIGATGFENVSQVLKTDRSGPFTSMSDNRQGLASYFDSADPVSTNWYDQTTALSVQQLNAYETVPGVNNGKPVWVPPDKTAENKPPGKDWHNKGSGPFKPSQWGYDPVRAEQDRVKREQKKATQGEKEGNKKHEHKHGEKTLSKRATKRKNLAGKLKEHNEITAEIFVNAGGFDVRYAGGSTDENGIYYIYEHILQTKKNLSKQVMDEKMTLKAQHPVNKDLQKDVKAANHKLINQAMHSLIASHDGHNLDLRQWQPTLNHINSVLTKMGVYNVLGTTLPEDTGIQGRYYTSVVGLFLSKVKRQLMEIAFFRVVSVRNAPDNYNNFVRHSLEATKILEKLIALKKYHTLPDTYDDSAALQAYHEYLVPREIQFWNLKNPQKKGNIPYFLKKQQPRTKEEKQQDYEAAIAKRAQTAKTTKHESKPAPVTGKGGGHQGKAGRPGGLPGSAQAHLGYRY
jgi:hypothetical protein